MKKALVIVSFGTTYERARRSIDAVERALAQAAEGYDVFRAYTSSIVRKVLKSRGEIVPSLEEALEKLANESYDTVFVQPTHLLCGNEYDEKIRASYMRYAGRFLRGGIGKPLIANNDDLLKLAEILAALKPDDADALLLMGHGTTHFANMVYPAMQTALRLQGHPNVVVGTVEGWPTLQDIIDGKLDDCGIAHDWHKEAQGKTYLLFRAEDAPSLVRAFDEMSRELAAEFARARERARDLGKDRAHGDHARAGANERLADKAEMAKAAAEELRKNAHEVPDRERTFNRERAQGR